MSGFCTSIRVTCHPLSDGEAGPCFTSSWEILSLAEGRELLRIKDHGFESEAHGRRARHLALCSFLPLIECGREFVPVVHDRPDFVVVLATIPGRDIVASHGHLSPFADQANFLPDQFHVADPEGSVRRWNADVESWDDVRHCVERFASKTGEG